MKKTLSVLFVLLIVSSLVFAGGASESSNGTAAASSDTTTVKVGLICIGDENDQGYTYNSTSKLLRKVVRSSSTTAMVSSLSCLRLWTTILRSSSSAAPTVLPFSMEETTLIMHSQISMKEDISQVLLQV